MTDTDSYREEEAAFWQDTVGARPSERMQHLPGRQVTVRLLEHGDGPALLLFHGGPNAATTWAPLVPHLAGLRCIMVDRPGCGLSERPAERPQNVRAFMAAFVEELLAVLEPGPIGLVASSFGSYSVLAYQCAHPAATLPAIHFGCPALVPRSKTPLRFLLQSLPGFRSIFLRLEPPTMATARKAFRQIGHQASLREGRIPEGMFRWYASLLRHTRTRENELALFAGIRPRDRLTEAELSGVSAPTSFFWGADDTFGGAETAEVLTGLIPGAALQMVNGAGHLPWLDFPEAAGLHVRRFMEEQEQNDES